jgi:mannosyltransferase
MDRVDPIDEPFPDEGRDLIEPVVDVTTATVPAVGRIVSAVARTSAPVAQPPATASTLTRHPWAPSGFTTKAAFIAFIFGTAIVANRTPLWGDEAFSVTMSKLPWSDMVKEFSHIDVNMSLYHLVLGVWVRLFGDGELATRSLSILCVVIGLWRLGHLVRSLLDARTARLTQVLALLNPAMWIVAITDRPYALLFVGSIALTELLVRAIVTNTTAKWLTWAAGAVVVSHVHMTGTLTVAAHIGVVALYHRPKIATIVKMAGVLVLGTMPALIWLAPANTLAWLTRPTPARAVGVVLDAAGGVIIGAAAMVLALVGAFALRRRKVAEGRVHRSVITAGIVVPFIIICAMFVIQSLFVALYFTVLLPSLLVLAAVGWQHLVGRRRILALAALVLCVVSMAWTLGSRPTAGEQNWRAAVGVLGDRALPGDAIVFPNTFYRIAAERESTRDNRWLAAKPVLPSTPWFSQKPHELDGFKRDGLQLVHNTIERELAPYSTLWLVGPADREMSVLTSEAQRMGFVVADTTMAQDVEVIRLTRTNPWDILNPAPVP